MNDAQLKTREQVRQEGVAERGRLPANAMRLLRLLEVVANRTRADAQQANLARFFFCGGVAGRGLELGLEVLREPDADGLLGIAARVQRPAGGIDDSHVFVRNSCSGSILIADLG